MKILFAILILFCMQSQATNYYVSASGNNSNAGTSPGSAWQTVAKVVSSLGSINSGDSVLFNRGDVFPVTASILMTKIGIKFGAYGTGVKPKLSALVTVTSWELVSTGLYRAPLTAPNDLRYVQIDGAPVEWARTPNKNLDTFSYYYSTAYSNGSPKTITLRGLPAGIDRTGNRFAFKGETWAMAIGRCTSQTGSTLSYVPGSENLLGLSPAVRYPSKGGTGVCFVGNIIDCDQYGEWAYDSTNHYLYMFFGAVNPNSKVVKAAGVDRIFDFAGYYNFSIENIDIEGANKLAIYGKNAGTGSQTFKKIKITGCGGKGILFSNQPNITIEDDTMINVYSTSIRSQVNGGSVRSNYSIKRNYIIDNGPFETMHSFGDFSEDGSAIVSGGNDAEISDNTIIRSHYHGIWATGTNVSVLRNHVKRHGMWNNDCGGIYSFAFQGYGAITTYYNRYVADNDIDSGYAFVYGYQSKQSPSVKGIYNDSRAHNIYYYHNLITNCDQGASNNNPDSITFRNNTFVGRRGFNFIRRKYADLTGFNIKGNYIINTTNTATTYYYYTDSIGLSTVAQDFAGDVSIDSNICNSVNTAYSVQTDKTALTNYYFTGWKTITGVSANDSIVTYFPLGETSLKLVVNQSDTTRTFTLLNKYKDYQGRKFSSGSIVLTANTWILLLYDGPLDYTPPPNPTPGIERIKAPMIFKNQ